MTNLAILCKKFIGVLTFSVFLKQEGSKEKDESGSINIGKAVVADPDPYVLAIPDPDPLVRGTVRIRNTD
jgi:hypothetical protein